MAWPLCKGSKGTAPSGAVPSWCARQGKETVSAEPIALPESWNGFRRTFLVTGNDALMEFTRQHLHREIALLLAIRHDG